MKKLAKYLKPFIGGVLVAIVLLFAQAMCDLNLPNYMSDIVNVGIQQGGIEHSAPDAISDNGMTLIMSLLTLDERATVDGNYKQVAVTEKNAEGKAYSALYPNASDTLYIRINDSTEPLDDIFGTATWTLINAMQSLAPQDDAQSAEAPSMNDMDAQALYQMQPMLDMLGEAGLAPAHEKALAVDPMLRVQSGISMAKMFADDLGADISGIQTRYILIVGAKMLLIALLGGIAAVLVGLLASRIAGGVARNLRCDVFNKIESFSSAEFDKFSTASLITRCTNDITQIQMLLTMGIRIMCYAPIIGIGGVIMAVDKSPAMSWIVAVACVVLLGLIMVIVAITLPRFKKMQRFIDRLNLVSRENLSGLMVVRAFGTQKHEKKRFEDANLDLAKTNLFVNRVMTFMMPSMMFIMNIVTLIIVWVGAHQIADSAMQVGDMMAFMQYAMQIIMAFLTISMMFIFVPRAAVSADRIAEVLNTELSINDPPREQPWDSAKRGLVEFKNVSFRYLDAPEDTLSSLNFTARPGETTAIIGATGSGKSTIANLLMRFYDVTEGEILVDGVNVRQVSQKTLRSKIGFVPQKGVLLSGTIASNIKYGEETLPDDKMREAAEIAQASDFIGSKENGFDDAISQGGSNVSGGQKQRLSIARALAKNPEILVFDDSFSALDFKTDSALRHALKAHTGDSTVIVVAQRVSTIMNAEQILVLDDGKIVGSGTHGELLKSCPQYLEIASSQLSKEELQ